MNPSERKLRKILESNKPLLYRIIDFYIKYAVASDVFLGIVIVLFNLLLLTIGLQYIFIEKEDISDILNELISSALSAGGFVLAALAIIASIRQSVKEVAKEEKPSNGREYFFNSIGYINVLKMYSLACIVFLLSFLFFSFVRGSASFFSGIMYVSLTTFGVVLVSLTFLRCILFLWAIIKI